MPEAAAVETTPASTGGALLGKDPGASPAPVAEEKPVEAQDGAPQEGEETKEAVGAPEKYDDFQLPEGVNLDTKLVEAFVPLAKELNLTQEQAQRLVSLQAEHAATSVKAQQEEWANVMGEWQEKTKTDKEIGGTKFNETLKLAAEPLNKFGNDAFREMLEVTGAGNHPEMVRFMWKVGKAMAEDTMIGTGGSGSGEEPNIAKRLFPNQN